MQGYPIVQSRKVGDLEVKNGLDSGAKQKENVG